MVTLDSTVCWGNSHGYFRQHCLLGRILMVTLDSTVCWGEFSWLL